MTQKQTISLNKVVENGGNVSKAMRESGYSKATAKNPKKLTNSKAWSELMESYLDDNELLSALLADIRNKPGDRKQLLELAFKLKGRLQNNIKLDSPKPVPLLDFAEVVSLQKSKYEM